MYITKKTSQLGVVYRKDYETIADIMSERVIIERGHRGQNIVAQFNEALDLPWKPSYSRFLASAQRDLGKTPDIAVMNMNAEMFRRVLKLYAGPGLHARIIRAASSIVDRLLATMNRIPGLSAVIPNFLRGTVEALRPEAVLRIGERGSLGVGELRNRGIGEPESRGINEVSDSPTP